MQPITDEIRKSVRELIWNFFSEECEVEPSEIKDETDILAELEGDSLMFLSLLELVKKKYALDVHLKTLGKVLMRRPAKTVGQVVELTLLIIEHGEGIQDL